MKATLKILVLCVSILSGSCQNVFNEARLSSTSSTAPLLKNLAVGDTTENSIELEMPLFTVNGDPLPAVNAYIGIEGQISVSGSTVTGNTDESFDVSSSGCIFENLNSNTGYSIIVIAENSKGRSVKQITQSTSPRVPALNSITVAASDAYSITVDRPTFSIAGNPSPAVSAFAGLKESITIDGKNVSGHLLGPITLTDSEYTFSGLIPDTLYTIIIIAENIRGYDSASIDWTTNKLPSTPAQPSLTPGNPGTTRLKAQWQPAANADTYQVWISRQNNPSTAQPAGEDISGLSFDINGLQKDTSYYVWIKSVNAYGISSFSPVSYCETNLYTLREPGPSGGLIFYIENDPEVIKQRGWKYLEAAKSGTVTGSILWAYKDSGTNTHVLIPGARGTAIGTGRANTQAIDTALGQTDIAAERSLNHQITSSYGVIYRDWFLPSRDELIEMCWVLQGVKQIGTETIENPEVPVPVGEFNKTLYWSSTELNQDRAYYVSFSNGAVSFSFKETNTLYYRPIRAFIQTGFKETYIFENSLFKMIYAKDHDDTINFPIGENDSGTGSLGKRFYIAESEATNQLIKTVLQWAYNNGRFSDNFTDHNGIDSAAAKHGGRTIINLSGSKITFRTETKEFSVENGYQNYPADYVSWYGAVIFCNWLTEMRDSSTDNLAYTGITENWDHNNTVCDYNKTGFRLPSKNEWEYAARYRGNDNTNIVLGYQFPYYTKGNSFSGATATANQYWAGWGEPSKSINDALAVYGQYYNGSSWVQTGVESAAEVMTKTPNTLGLYDMSGNLSEWTFDKYSTTMRYMKGGCWNNPASQLTIGLNATGEPAVLNSNNGFRLARTAD